MQTHITYNTAKKLKVFLGENAPEPMDSEFSNAPYWRSRWEYSDKERTIYFIGTRLAIGSTSKLVGPAYQLHDLLSKPFCEAMAKKVFPHGEVYLAAKIFADYYNGGLPAVEKVLMEMMEGK